MTEQEFDEKFARKFQNEMAKIRKRRILLFAIGVALVPISIWAATTVPHIFNDGDTLSASKLNENFVELNTKINNINTKTELRLGTYCGKTESTYTGSTIGGYIGAKSKCETACSNLNAHMCTAHEMSISLQLGIVMDTSSLWYSTYTRHESGSPTNDCSSWTSDSGAGSHKSSTVPHATNWQACNNASAIACCL